MMNPTVPQSLIDRAMERDPAVAGAEWLAQFRTDVERLFTREAVVGLCCDGCDRAGGSSQCSLLCFCRSKRRFK